MKKIFFLASLVILPALSASAVTVSPKLSSRAEPRKINKREVAGMQGERKMPETPKGDLVYYNKEAVGTFVLGGAMMLYEDVFPAEVIWGADNKVYLKNLVSAFPDEYYVEGVLEGDYITIPTNQTVVYSDEDGYGFNFGVLKTGLDQDGDDAVYTFSYAPEISSIRIKVASDGSMEMELPGEPFDGETPPEYVAGIYFSDNYEFTGYSDFTQKYEKLEIKIETMPEDAEPRSFVFIDEFNYANVVEVAFYGHNLYIRGLNPMLPDGTLRATIEGDKAYIDQDEYLGIYYDLYYIFTKVLLENPDYDPEDDSSEPFILAPADARFELNIDKDRNRIYADKEGVYLSFHCNENDFLNSLGYYGIFQMKYQSTFAGVPSNPVGLEYHTEWADIQGWNDFFFTLSNFSTDDLLLDADKLYYKVFVNGTPVVFEEKTIINLNGDEATAYEGVPIAVELMPYFFSNNEDIFKFNDNIFDVGIYTDDVATIGVQTVYYYDNVFTYSDIVTLDVATGEITTESGVDVVVSDEVEDILYYTIEGRRVSQPGSGLYIEVTRKVDGTISARKIIR